MSGTMVKRAYRYRFYPTDEQSVELSRTFGCVRLVYNRALEARTTAWRLEQRRVGYSDTSALLTAWKQTDELGFLNEVSSVPLQQCLRHLQKAFTSFFGKRGAYPRFKSRKKSRTSAEYTRSGFRWRDGQLTLAKVNAPLAIVWSRPLPEGAEPSIEDLAVRNMVRNHNLARAISDASWSQFRSMLTYKAQWHGRAVIAVNRWYPSSKTCSHCGHLLEALPLSLREWTCPGCDEVHDRDINAARNILAAGRAVTACGDGIRPNRR